MVGPCRWQLKATIACQARDRADLPGASGGTSAAWTRTASQAEIAGGVHFDRFTRGRYATDASHYQIMPLGVVTPKTIDEAERAIALAREEGVSLLPRGGGSSQAGQTVNNSLVIDCSKHLNRVLDLDVAGRRCRVEPGIVLDDLNRATQAAWAVVPGRCLDRVTRHHRRHDREQFLRRPLAALRQHARERPLGRCCPRRRQQGAFRPRCGGLVRPAGDSPLKPLARDLFALGTREARRDRGALPKVQRRVGGYNIDALVPGKNDVNLAHILVGSEGTLAFSTAVELKLSPVLGRRAVGAVPLRQLPRSNGGGAAHRQAGSDRGGIGRLRP